MSLFVIVETEEDSPSIHCLAHRMISKQSHLGTKDLRFLFHDLNQQNAINKCISAFCGFKTWNARRCTV